MRFYKGFRKDLRSRYISAFVHYYHFGLQSIAPLFDFYSSDQAKSSIELDGGDFSTRIKGAAPFIPKTRWFSVMRRLYRCVRKFNPKTRLKKGGIIVSNLKRSQTLHKVINYSSVQVGESLFHPFLIKSDCDNAFSVLENPFFEGKLNELLVTKFKLGSLKTPLNLTLTFGDFAHSLNFVNRVDMGPSPKPYFHRLALVSRYELPFIFSSVGFLFISAPTTLWGSEYHYDFAMTRARINSHRYSFFYKNDLKRIYIRKPGLLKLLTSFQRDLSLAERGDVFMHNHFNFPHPSISGAGFTKSSPTVASQFFQPSIDIYRPLEFYKGLWGEVESNGSDYVIKRVRFKPGYQRI